MERITETIYHPFGEAEQQIRYEKKAKKEQKSAWRVLAWQCIMALLLCLGAAGLRQWAPEGAAKLRSLLVAQEPDFVSQAASCFLEDLAAGEPVGQAVAAFCEELAHGG